MPVFKENKKNNDMYFFAKLMYNQFKGQVVDLFSESFYRHNQQWICESDIFESWVDELYDRDFSPKKAARIIERAHSMYVKKLSQNK